MKKQRAESDASSMPEDRIARVYRGKEYKLHSVNAFDGKDNPVMITDIKEMVPKGWDLVMETLIHDLLDMGWDGEIQQVKEKFGTLRFYAGSTTNEMEERIHRASCQTEFICAECGALATNFEKSGWFISLCDKHARKMK